MRILKYILSALLCSSLIACDINTKNGDENNNVDLVEIQRYDRTQSLYLTTGDFSALQQMSTDYPVETRTLIEDVLKLGSVSTPDIYSKFLTFYQDSVLQNIISEAESQYANVDDLNKQFSAAFKKLKSWLPDLKIPMVYTQISALDQSVIIGESSVGISLDKYLGKDYPTYAKYYTEEQRNTMSRDYILPDCISFFLLSKFPLPNFATRPQTDRDAHIGKIQWVANKAMDKNFFTTDYVRKVERYMQQHSNVSIAELLKMNDYSDIK